MLNGQMEKEENMSVEIQIYCELQATEIPL